MDPLTLASAFGSIVGLMGLYKQERRESSSDSDNVQAFLLWLDSHRHNELKELITSSPALSNSLDQLLRENQTQLLEKLDGINEVCAQIASQVGGFSSLVNSMRPQSELSDQALFILKRLNESGASEFASWDDESLQIMARREDINGEPMIEVKDPRFLKDDLEVLVAFGFLLRRISGQGYNYYAITRAAVRFLDLHAR